MTQANVKDAYKLMHLGTLALNRAQLQGIRIDLDYCYEQMEELTVKITELENVVSRTKFYKDWKRSLKGKEPNIMSNSQLSTYLYNVLELTAKKATDSGGGATDEAALSTLGIPELDSILKIRRYKKIKDTYLGGFVKEAVNGYIHPNFNLHLVKTFRSSSNAPNFQNIPKRDKMAKEVTRRALFPRPGHQLLEIDFGGIEVCISACYHKDPNMIKYIVDPSTDMHRDMAKQIFFIDEFVKNNPAHKDLRSASKNGFVFPQFYGDYYVNCAHSLAHTWGKLPEGRWGKGTGIEMGEIEPLFLSDHLKANGIRTFTQFTEHIRGIENEFWSNRFKVYAQWKDKIWTQYQRKGYVELLTGFQCGGVMSKNDATNYPIQGAAFHCLLWSFIQTDKILRKRKFRTKLIGQIHDAMILDVHPEELQDVVEILVDVMTVQLRQAWKWIIVPLTVEVDLGPVDGSWYELEPYKI